MIGEKCETCGIKYKYCKYYLDYTNIKDDLIAYKCLCVTIITKAGKRRFHSSLNMEDITKAAKRRFHSSLNMEDITDADYRHAKRI